MAKGIGDVFYSLLSNDTGVTDITSTRIYPFMAIEDIAYPYLVYTIEGTDPTQTKCTASVLDVVSVNIEIYSETLTESETLKRNIRNLLDRYKGTVEGIEVQSISFRDEDGGYADEDRVYVDVQSYSCRLKTITASFSRVTDLAAVGSSTTVIGLTWSDVATGETGWEVWRSTDFISWTLISTEIADSVSYSDTGLTADTSYIYKVRAINTTTEGEWSNVSIGNTETSAVAQSGIAYAIPPLTGLIVSYATGDDADNLDNYTPPTYPVSFARLDTTALSPFTTLVDNNVFGNKNRFTDINGLQTYGDDYVIDHLTRKGWYRVKQGANNKDWATAVSECNASTQNSYSDWFLPNMNEYKSIADLSHPNGFAFNNEPFVSGTMPLDGQYLWSSSTDALNTPYAHVMYSRLNAARAYRNLSQIKTGSTYNYFLCRNHY